MPDAGTHADRDSHRDEPSRCRARGRGGERSARSTGSAIPCVPARTGHPAGTNAAGEETIRHIGGRFFIKRLVNIGATGYRRSWIDNILWHHFCHFVDLGLYLFDGTPIRRIQSHLGPLHHTTGIPMECIVMVETEADQTLLVHGSYHATYRFYDKLIVTDRETYFYDILAGTLRTGRVAAIENEQRTARAVIVDSSTRCAPTGRVRCIGSLRVVRRSRAADRARTLGQRATCPRSFPAGR